MDWISGANELGKLQIHQSVLQKTIHRGFIMLGTAQFKPNL